MFTLLRSRSTIGFLALTAAASLVFAACAGGAATAPADEPAAGGEVDREIHVDAENVKFGPNVIEVKVGERVRLTLENHDAILHDLNVDEPDFVVLGTNGGTEHHHEEAAQAASGHDDADAGHEAAEEASHEGAEEDHEAAEEDHEAAEAAHDEAESHEGELVSAQPLHIATEGREHADLIFEATEPGEYVVYCSVEGHRAAGMEATLRVVE